MSEFEPELKTSFPDTACGEKLRQDRVSSSAHKRDDTTYLAYAQNSTALPAHQHKVVQLPCALVKKFSESRVQLAASHALCARALQAQANWHFAVLDTASDMLVCSAFKLVMEDGKFELFQLANHDHLCRRQANVELTESFLDCLDEAGLSIQELDAIVVGRGPGSFTGVRIGIASAKGLASGARCSLFGASSLDAIAWTSWLAGRRGFLGVVADAMRKELYPGQYVLDDDGLLRKKIALEQVVKAPYVVEAWAKEQASSDLQSDQLILSGNGLTKYQQLFCEAGLQKFEDEACWNPTGAGLALAALADTEIIESFLRGMSYDPALVLPLYTRLSDAEETERTRLGLGTAKMLNTSGFIGLADSKDSNNQAVPDSSCTSAAHLHKRLQLRPMALQDIAQVRELEARCFDPELVIPTSEACLKEQLNNSDYHWWLACDDTKIVGMAGGRAVAPDFELCTIAVAPEYRRCGIARKLLDRLAYSAAMLGIDSMLLEVDHTNEAACLLYKSEGFKEIGRRSAYYAPGHDALVMKLDGFSSALSAYPPVVAPRSQETQQKIAEAGALVLAIESSCDETAVAIIDAQGQIRANIVATQIDFHARFGGVVPEIASRKHTEAIVAVFEEALIQAGQSFGCDRLEPSDLAAIGVTTGPGLVGALVVGLAFAKGLAAATKLPLIAVNHLEGHLLANLFADTALRPPFVASLVSGGNTMLVHVKAWGDYEILGTTIDDAVGEAFDKVAKALGLGYPGGPVISRLAAQGNPKAIHFPRAMMHSGDYAFSLSGLKTSVISYIERERSQGRELNLSDLAASFEQAVIDVQVAKAERAVDETGVEAFCVGGGVAANPALRAAYHACFDQRGIRVCVPPFSACGDNAAMIAVAALRNFMSKAFVPLSIDAQPNAALDAWCTRQDPVVPYMN